MSAVCSWVSYLTLGLAYIAVGKYNTRCSVPYIAVGYRGRASLHLEKDSAYSQEHYNHPRVDNVVMLHQASSGTLCRGR